MVRSMVCIQSYGVPLSKRVLPGFTNVNARYGTCLGMFVVLSAIILFGVAWWTFQECYNVLGDFGWYYGDFFLPNPRLRESKESLSYVGIYRSEFRIDSCV